MPRCLFEVLAVVTAIVTLGDRASAVDVLATWDGATAPWTDASHWSTNPAFPNNNPPTFYDAVIAAGAVTLNQPIAINRLTWNGGSLLGSAALSLSEGVAWSGGATLALTGAGRLVLGAGSASSVSGSAVFQSGTIVGGGGATISVLAGATFTALNQAAFFADFASPAYSFSNAGIFTARSTSGVGFVAADAAFHNSGTVRVEVAQGGAAQTLSLAGGGTHSGAFELQGAATALEFGNNTTLQAGATITGEGTGIVAGSVVLAGAISAQNLTVAVGELNVGAHLLTVSGVASQLGGTTRLGGGTFRVSNGGSFNLDDGTFTGTGTLDAALSAQGTLAPGAPLGSLAVSGAANFGPDARLAIELGGTSTGSFDVLAISGGAMLGGELHVTLLPGFTPAASDTFSIFTSAVGASGFFSNVPADGARLLTSDGRGSFAVDYTPNAIVLTAFIPEPSVAAMALAAAIGICCRRPRRPAAR